MTDLHEWLAKAKANTNDEWVMDYACEALEHVGVLTADYPNDPAAKWRHTALNVVDHPWTWDDMYRDGLAHVERLIGSRCQCGAPLTTHDHEHPGKCCDCFDRALGIDPVQQREIEKALRRDAPASEAL